MAIADAQIALNASRPNFVVRADKAGPSVDGVDLRRVTTSSRTSQLESTRACADGENRGMHLAYTPEANALLADDPLALLIGMLLDQQSVVRTHSFVSTAATSSGS